MMTKKFSLKVITPERVIYDGQVREVILPTLSGNVGILADHVPYMAPLKADELVIIPNHEKKTDELVSLAIDFGIAEFVDNQLVILVAQAATAGEIDLEISKQARERAEALMKEKVADKEGYAAAQALLNREIAKIKVANKYRLKKRV